MSALVNALDSSNFKQIGEKGHTEYSWSNNLRDKLVQLSFQFTRTDKGGIEKLATILRQFLTDLVSRHKLGALSDGEYQELLITAYKMIGHTRDIVDGKGEYTLAYMQLLVWHEVFPNLALYALCLFVSFPEGAHPYGSWKDIKYFCNYCWDHGLPISHPLLQTSFQLLNSQIFKDSNASSKTLAGKWAAREKCTKFGWIFEQLAYSYFEHYLKTAKTDKSRAAAEKKCKMDYRKLCSRLNKELGTTQVYQCANRWAEIDHSKTTSITNAKQKKAFLNLTKENTQRTELEDRIQCAENFKARIRKAVAGEVEIKGKRVGLTDFTVQAFDLLRQPNSEEVQIQKDLLNSQWRDNASQTSALTSMLAMCDFSGSMSGDPLHACIALGIRVAEKSLLGKRVLSFSENPTWHNLDGCSNFVEMVDVLQRGEVGYSTNFHKAFDTILNAIIEKKLEPDQVSNMVLAIFSDMQIDEAESVAGRVTDTKVLYESIAEKYAAAGMRIHGVPFTPPHILFWNLRSTSGFPCLTTQTNVSMMSGFSPALLNLFCEQGIDAFKNSTPWYMLVQSMDNPRYQYLEDRVKELWETK